MTVPSPLCVVPAYLRSPGDLDVLLKCLVSLWSTSPQAPVLVVDDGSPAPDLVAQLGVAVAELGYALHVKPENEGFSRTVNVGLRRALETGADAVLVNADIEFAYPGWLEALCARTDTQGRPAAVAGARLLYPNRLIQHAGVIFSERDRQWWHRYQYGPADLPEAQRPARCVVTAALQLIRHDTLASIGLYDEGFGMAYEDVDYCLQVFAAGGECIYEPRACAVHAEQMFRGRGRGSERTERWLAAGRARLREKWRNADLRVFTPDAL